MSVIDKIVGFFIGLLMCAAFCGVLWLTVIVFTILRSSLGEHALKVVLSVVSILPIAYILGTGFVHYRKEKRGKYIA